MSFHTLQTRRQFLAWSGSAAVAAVVVSAPALETPAAAQSVTTSRTIYRLSSRGCRGQSRAAKLHAANKRFRTIQAAEGHRAHPGDQSRIVELDVSESEFQRLFQRTEQGQSVLVDVADLRAL